MQEIVMGEFVIAAGIDVHRAMGRDGTRIALLRDGIVRAANCLPDV